MTTYGYARVSTEEQSPVLQLDALKLAGCSKVFRDDGISGVALKRPALARCLKQLHSGDTLCVWKLDRLGRSLRDLVTLLDDLRARGVRFHSITEAINTETPAGRALWQIVAVMAEFERSILIERTRAGQKAAKARGVKFGRKAKLSAAQVTHARTLIGQGEAPPAVAQLLNVDRSTLYRALQRDAAPLSRPT